MVALECTPDRNLLLMNSSASKMKRSIGPAMAGLAGVHGSAAPVDV